MVEASAETDKTGSARIQTAMASHPMAGSDEGLRKEVFGAKVDRGGPFANSKLVRAWRVGGGFG